MLYVKLLELKFLRDLEVYEKVDEKEAVEKYGISPVDTKWVDTDKAIEGSQCKSDHECVRESSKAMIGQTCMHESNNIDCSEPQRNVFNHAHRRVTCVLPREGPETSADTTAGGGQNVRHEGRGQQLGT